MCKEKTISKNEINEVKILEKINIFAKDYFNADIESFQRYNNSYNRIISILLNIFVSLDNSWIDSYFVNDHEVLYLIDLQNTLKEFSFNQDEIDFIKENYLEPFFIIKSCDTGFLTIYFKAKNYNELEIFASNEYCNYDNED